MSPLVYQVLHVSSVLLLVGMTFAAFAAPRPERRGATMKQTGILSLIVIVSGFGLAAKFGYGFPVWMMIKAACWLGIAALSGVAFRKPESAGKLSMIAGLLVVIAVLAVYVRPFA